MLLLLLFFLFGFRLYVRFTISHFTVTLNSIYRNFTPIVFPKTLANVLRRWWRRRRQRRVFIHVFCFNACVFLRNQCSVLTRRSSTVCAHCYRAQLPHSEKRINRLKSNFKFNLVYSKSIFFLFLQDLLYPFELVLCDHFTGLAFACWLYSFCSHPVCMCVPLKCVSMAFSLNV